jgi:tetratricopeptide (TPR) repeat protein
MYQLKQADAEPQSTGTLIHDRSTKRFFVVFAGVFLFLLIIFAATVYWRERHHLAQAQHALDQLDWDKAADHLDHYLGLWPNDGGARLLAAQTARRRGQRREAEKHLDIAIHLSGVTSGIRLEQTLERAQEGDLGDVESNLGAKLKADDPQSLLILEALSRGYLSTLRMAQAMKTLDALLERRPDHYRALIWRGRAWELGSQMEKALEDYQRALSLSPNSVEARIQLASVLLRLARVREALGQYDYLCTIRPEDGELAVSRARACLDLHKIDEAREILDEVLRRQPDLVPALIERGRLAIRTGEASPAEAWLRRAVKGAPDNVEAHSVLGLCLDMQGKAEEASRVHARAQVLETFSAREEHLMWRIAERPQDPEPRYQLGILFLRAGREEEGQKWLRSARR